MTVYVAEGSTAVAIAFVEAVERTFLYVRTHPGAGSRRYAHELDIPGLRSWSVAGFPYLVFYRMEAHTLTVWRVLHAERDIPEHLQAKLPSRGAAHGPGDSALAPLVAAPEARWPPAHHR